MKPARTKASTVTFKTEARASSKRALERRPPVDDLCGDTGLLG